MGNGLWDGHEYRATAKRSDILSALSTAVVIVDTNVLLDLYRYVSEPRNELVRALGELNERLFIPHQVGVEFWRGREGALNDSSIRSPTAVKRLEEVGDEARTAINEWANRVGLSRESRSELLDTITSAVEGANAKIRELVAVEQSMRVTDTSKDAILDRIIELTRERVGDGPDEDVLTLRHKEGLRRANSGEPPGYRDNKKDPSRVVGDYLIWCEAMDAACERGTDLVLVTRDTKEDWWEIVSGVPRGPRIELVQEFWAKSSGKRAYFLRPSQFVSMISEAHDWSAPDVVAQLESAERFEAGGEWNRSTAGALLEALYDFYRPQYNAVVYAAQNGGRIPRETLYEMSGYEADRTLRGFGRPVNRLARRIYDPQDAMEDFPAVFDSFYNSEVSWVQAAGFYLDDDLADAVQDALLTGEIV